MTDRNDDLFDAARAVIPGGVNSPVRAYGSVGGTPRFLASASGATVTDAAGTTYLDLVASWGPALLGHAHVDTTARYVHLAPAHVKAEFDAARERIRSQRR